MASLLFKKNAKESQLNDMDHFLPLKESQSLISVHLTKIYGKNSITLIRSGQFQLLLAGSFGQNLTRVCLNLIKHTSTPDELFRLDIEASDSVRSFRSSLAVHIGVANDQLAILKMLNKDKIK